MKKILSVLITVSLIMSSVVMPVGAEEIKEIHVSPNGDDGNSGTQASPFKTLDKAKDYIETLDLNSINGDINVIFHEGKYVFSESVEFDLANSGSEDVNIIYKAADGERVIFSGATQIPASKIKTVTDEALLSKLSASAGAKLVSVKLSDCGIEALPAMNTISLYNELYNGKEYVALYNDGKEQPLSQWPNGDDEYASWIEATDKGDAIGGKNGGTFVYSEDRPSRWTTNVTDIWVAGYPGYNYRYERNSVSSINTQTKQIKLATPTCFGLINKETKPWKAFNVFEEIDMPGEWYIDRKTMMLYYYQPDRQITNLELSTLDDAFIKLNDAEYISFSGIEFEKNRETAIEMTCVNNINITDCTFADIGTDAIYMSGKTLAKTDSSYIDAASDCLFSGNIFYNIGGSVIRLYGGNADDLTNGNVVFKNNYVYGAARKIKNREMIIVYGCGNTVSNNNISSSSFQAIRYYGNNHNISNNEIYNVNKASDDAGVVYSGRNYIQRGSVISYNFIHDSNPIRNKSRGFATGIYWDDSQAGQYAHHNIVKGINVGAYACGQDNKLESNIFVDCAKNGILFTNTYEGNSDRKTREQSQYDSIFDKELYNRKYKNLSKGLNSSYIAKNVFNVVKNNLTVDSGINEIYKNSGNTVTGNSQVDVCNDLNASDKLDYRVKENSQTANNIEGILTTSYDLKNIGNETDVFNTTASLATFDTYNASVDGDKVILRWADALGANQYRVIVATDEAMSHKVIDTVVDYNFYEADELEVTGEYYWTVYAVNTSYEYAGEWQCRNGVTSLKIKEEAKDFENVTEFKTENLIVNGGFEKGLEGWVTDGTGVFTVVENNFTSNSGKTYNVVNGTKAAKATSGDKTAGYMYQEVDVTANTNYVLNLSWFHLSTGKGSVKVYGDEISNSNLLATVGNIFGGEVWYSSTAAFNSKEYEKIIVNFDFSYATAGVYYCVDNITLKAAGNTQTIGFESGYPEDFNIRSNNFEVTTEKAYEGTHSIKMTSGSAYPLANVTFALNPERHYAVMFWYYIESGSLGFASKYAHQNGWKDYTTNPIRMETLKATGEWKRAIVTPDDNVTGSLKNSFVEVAFQNMAPNTVVYIDNIQCKYYDESVDSITVTSENEDGGYLKAVANAYNHGYDFHDPVEHQWQRSDDKSTWTDISGANGENYKLMAEDAGKYIRVKINTFNRYSTYVVDSYYSKAVQIGDVIFDSVYLLTDSSGKKITELSEITDGELNVKFLLKYLQNNSMDVFAAVYDESNALCSVKTVDTEAVSGASDSFEFTLTLPEKKDLTGYTFKAYVWDEGMKPLVGINN